MLKAIYAVAIAGFVAAGFIAFPSLSAQVQASAPELSGKSDRADTRPLAADCSQRGWPYFGAGCLRDARNPMGQVRPVRYIPLDRLSSQ